MRCFKDFFLQPIVAMQRQYEALRAFYVDRMSAREVAHRFGYTLYSFNSLRRDFAREAEPEKFFVVRERRPGSRRRGKMALLRERVIELRRKKYWSILDIQQQLWREGHELHATSIFRILNKAGFSRLPWRLKEKRRHLGSDRQGGG